jgi:hypothetical protein
MRGIPGWTLIGVLLVAPAGPGWGQASFGTLTHSNDNGTIQGGNGVACGAPDNSFVRGHDLTSGAWGSLPATIQIDSVTFGVETATGAPGLGYQPIRPYPYLDDGDGNPAQDPSTIRNTGVNWSPTLSGELNIALHDAALTLQDHAEIDGEYHCRAGIDASSLAGYIDTSGHNELQRLVDVDSDSAADWRVEPVAGNTGIQVEWFRAADNGGTLNGAEAAALLDAWMDPLEGGIFLDPASWSNVCGHTHSGLDPGTSYYYRVRNRNRRAPLEPVGLHPDHRLLRPGSVP